jgi:nicotinamidase-related amidase
MKQALLIIDVQQALCSGPEAAFDIEGVVERINALAAQARAAGVPVVLVQHQETEGSLQFNSAGWRLYERLDARPDDLRVRKTAPDSFERTSLREMLQQKQVDQLVVGGLQTDCCVDATVRRSVALGYPVVLVSDAHSTIDQGGRSAAQVVAEHNEALGNLRPHVTLARADEVRIEACAQPTANCATPTISTPSASGRR